jgi:hypothetical protein
MAVGKALGATCGKGGSGNHGDEIKVSAAKACTQMSTKLVSTKNCDAMQVDMDDHVSGDEFVHGLGEVMTQWAKSTANNERAGRRVTCFDSLRAPSTSIMDYLKRLHKYFLCSDECFVMALVYIDRVGKIDSAMVVCELNVHRLLFIVTMVAAKFHDDVYYSNSYYAKVGGLSPKEVNALEVKLLKMLGWNVVVSPQDYMLYRGLVNQSVHARHRKKEPEPEP